MALAQESPPAEPVDDLVSRVISLRPATDRGPSMDSVADWLSYDVALVRLCERLEVDHGMLDSDAGPASRARAESLVAERIPFFRDALGIG